MSRSPGELARTPRRAWVGLTVVAGALAAADAVGAVVLLLGGRWIESLLGVLGVLGCSWFAMGAWRRTPWGLATPETAPPAPPAPPALSAPRARAYVAVGATCVVAVAIALAFQVAGRSP